MKRTSPWCACLALALLIPTLCAAQPVWETGGSMHLSYAPDAVVTEAEIEPLQPFQFYLLVGGTDIGGGVSGYEVAVSLHPDILFSGIELRPPSSLNIGGFLNGRFDAVVGMGVCLQGEYVAVIQFTALLLEEVEDVFLGLSPHSPSSVEGVAPAWLGCDGLVYAVENDLEAGKLWINKSPVATEASSWSKLKSLYR